MVDLAMGYSYEQPTVVGELICESSSNCYKNSPQCQLPQGWGQVLMSNPHLDCGDAWGGGVGLEIDKRIRFVYWFIM